MEFPDVHPNKNPSEFSKKHMYFFLVSGCLNYFIVNGMKSSFVSLSRCIVLGNEVVTAKRNKETKSLKF